MPRWELTLADIGLSTRARNVLRRHDITKAWHAAVLCHRCISLTYNCGRKTRMEIATVLQHAGFPAPIEDCGQRTTYGHGQQILSPCRWAIKRCRAMLERGEWN